MTTPRLAREGATVVVAPADFAAMPRELMAERGLSMRGLAREIPIDQGQLSRVLNRVRTPSAGLARRCDEVFGTGGLLGRAAEQARATKSWSVNGIGPDGQSTAPPDRTHPMPQNGAVPDPLDAVTGALPRRDISPEAVRSWEDMVILLRRLDDEVGSGHLIGTVSAQLTAVTTLLSRVVPGGDSFRG